MATSITVSNQSSRIYPGSTVSFSAVVSVDGTPTDASAITFKYRIGDGKITTVSPTKTATGTYSVSITLDSDEFGFLYTLWDTQGGLDTAKEQVFMIEPGAFGWSSTNDYGASL